jgi:hypothetical protein
LVLPIEVAVKDSQSNPNRAAEVAKELIVSNKRPGKFSAANYATRNAPSWPAQRMRRSRRSDTTKRQLICLG